MGGAGIAPQELRSFPVAGPPLLRHPSHVTGSAGSAHAEGQGLCLGAGPVRDDWHPRKPKESPPQAQNVKSESGNTKKSPYGGLDTADRSPSAFSKYQ